MQATDLSGGARVAGLVAGVAILISGLATTSASANVVCAYDAAAHTVTVNVTGSPPGTAVDGVGRDGDTIIAGLTPPSGFPQCGSATVFNTDTIVVNDPASASALSIATNLAPGFTDEPGGSDEIEIVLNEGAGVDGISFSPGTYPPVTHAIALGSAAGQGRVNLNAGEADGLDSDVTLNGVEGVVVYLQSSYGGTTADVIRADGSAGTGGAPFAGALTVPAGPGDDIVVGGTGDDIFLGGDGDDVLEGGAGVDRLNGDEGNDVVRGGAGADRGIEGGSGNDRLFGGPGADSFMRGANGNDRLFGDEGADTDLLGGTGTDTIFGGPSNDELFGEGGNDRLFGQTGNDDLEGGGGSRDECRGGPGRNRLRTCELP